MSDLDLAAAFPAAEEEQWLGLVEKVLAGRDFRRSLVTKTRDAIEIEPLYGQQDSGPATGGRSGRWTVFQRVDHPHAAAANRLVRADLDGGADGLELVFPGAIGANGYGVGVNTVADLTTVLDGVDLTGVKLRIDGGYQSRPAMVLAIALARTWGLEPGSVDIVGQSDPANGLVGLGRLLASYDRVSAWSVDLAYYLVETGWNVAPFVADGRTVHGGGGSEAQELAYCLSVAVEHMRVLEKGGLPADAARRLVTFSLAADADQFATIAKFRAIRILWDRVQEACRLTPEPARIHAETSWRMMSRRDPWVNLLRTTVATAAAGIGGADSLTVLPFTTALGLPDGFARRLARNTQLVLIEEAAIGRVGDPAAGSGYVEALTGRMCEAAWAEFQRIEAEGGIIESAVSGLLQRRIKAVQDARIADVAHRKVPLTGVSEFPYLAELPVRTLRPETDDVELSGEEIDIPQPARGARYSALVAAVERGASISDIVATAGLDWIRCMAVPRYRLAEPFERLRDASDRVRDQSGKRPAVFLATIGTMADFTVRAGFARNAFEAGGLVALGADVYADQDAMALAFARSGARIACICGTDAGYEEHAADYARVLKANEAAGIYLAGRPGERERDWAEAGVDEYLFAGCDILSFLDSAYRRLGIKTDAANMAGEDVR
ncbi:methylmalonyl-CoA mutase family protein [Microbaculum marinum]|uniref:Methylmalonyl-CoA mutase family protein n=1 Tax=Microbaculum marinum TaxID=1764581 RepID=A0AAW9RV18_9HYPH